MTSFRQAFKDQTTLYVFVAVLFLVGVLFGALMVNALSLEQQQEMARYLNHFFVNVQDGGEAMSQSSFWSIAALHMKWVGLIWILGMSVIGLPGILILDFLKGVLIGFTVGYLVGQYSWKGLLFALVSIAPQNLLIIPVLMICSVAAISFSLYIIRTRLIMNKGGSIVKPFVSYSLMTLFMVLLTLGVASFETWVSPAMMRWVTPMLLQAADFSI
ncbi:stage II sporulation protein M [Paenibacillus sp. JCM 10914]|uniref:stage II sporulation protein M n=1 Tax=Paenibacillus sp. JCM 10914 TaxID=1236974 RepID=UPI0003CC38F9|nr:stage II sporulation protein M [Paenibacillus sp. JCM 10914]GAE04597.1 stage II sporulation protein M [Paenibacillus sp. JCM 10914]